MSGFFKHSAQKSGQNRIADKSDATGHEKLKVDLCTTLSGFFDRNGQMATLAEINGHQRKEQDILSVERSDLNGDLS